MDNKPTSKALQCVSEIDRNSSRPCFCSRDDYHCQYSKFQLRAARSVCRSQPNFSQFASYNPWFLLSISFPPSSESTLSKANTPSTKDFFLRSVIRTWLPLLNLRTYLLRATSIHSYIPSRYLCYLERRQDVLFLVTLVLVTTITCALNWQSITWWSVFSWLFLWQWVIFSLRMISSIIPWMQLAQCINDGILKSLMSRLYGPGMLSSFFLISLVVCGFCHRFLNLVYRFTDRMIYKDRIMRQIEASAFLATQKKQQKEAQERKNKSNRDYSTTIAAWKIPTAAKSTDSNAAITANPGGNEAVQEMDAPSFRKRRYDHGARVELPMIDRSHKSIGRSTSKEDRTQPSHAKPLSITLESMDVQLSEYCSSLKLIC